MSDPLDVTLARVFHHKVGKFGKPGGIPYLIARTTTGLTVKGQMRTPVVGEKYRLWGSLRPQKGYPDAFEFTGYEILCDRSVGGMAAYLSRHIPGIGHVKARIIVDSLGIETLDILRTAPEQIASLPGIKANDITSIRDHFAESKNSDPAMIAKLTELFEGYRFPRSVAKKSVEIWGSSAAEVIMDNPYLLMDLPRVGWKLVDPFATEKIGYPELGKYRHQAAITEALTQISMDGHTAATKAEMLTQCEALLGSQLHPEALASAVDEGRIVTSDDGSGIVYQTYELAHAEEAVAERLTSLVRLGPPPIEGLVSEEWAEEHGLGYDQLDAALNVERYPVSIVTGGPGVGKSFLISRLVKRLRDMGHTSIRCVAPTGKAAKRTSILLAEVGISGVPSTTIHKALEPGLPEREEEGVPADDAKFGRGRSGWSFARHAANPLSEKIIICDETSMLDCKIASSLLLAIAPGTRLIFVGDHNQLPSVGPGSVLRDMMASIIPTATLAEIRRSDQAGTVVHACHAIMKGDPPVHATKIAPPSDNWIHIEIDDPDEIASKIVEIVTNIKTFDRMWGVQVISPRKNKLPFACENLNSLLSRALNPENHRDIPLTDPETGATIGGLDTTPCIGDKIVRTKNEIIDELIELDPESDERSDLTWHDANWAARPVSVVNGDTGIVLDIIEGSRPKYIIRFMDPERLCQLPIEDSHIMLAYAMTVHKMQGSGSPCIVAPLHHDFYFDEKTGRGLWNRELFYTLISRMERVLITVGQWSAALAACRRKTVDRRRTTLASRLKAIANPGLKPLEDRDDGIRIAIPDDGDALERLESEFDW